jgi:hypothetical protein
MTAVIKKFAKAPAEKLDYAVEYGKELARLEDTIASSQWIVPSNTVDGPGNQAVSLDDGVTVDYGETSPSPVFGQGGTLFTDTKATIHLSGGTLAQEYTLENRIVTAAGRKYSRRITIVVQAK